MSLIALDPGRLENRSDGFSVEALAGVLDPAWVREAIVQAGALSERVRRLPSQLTLWLLVLMGLFRRHSYVNLLAMFYEAGVVRGPWREDPRPPTGPAFVRARDRLGVAPAQLLFERSAREWVSSTEGLRFHGQRVFAVDGTTMRIPDTEANEVFFGRPGASRGRAGYPQLRQVTLRDVGTRLCLGVRFGPCREAEIRMAQSLLQAVETGSLVLVDRNFVSYAFLWDLSERGADFVVRAKQNLRFEVVEQLGRGDQIVRIQLSRNLRRKRPDLPEEWLLRRIVYRPEAGREDIHLLTSLLLAEETSAHEIAALYPERWEEETGYDEVKTHLCTTTTITMPTTLRSKAPERILQEAYAVHIAYNAVRATMALAAPRAVIDDSEPAAPRRLGFVHALERLREAVRDMIQLATTRLIERYDQLLTAIARLVVPLRPGRRYPRAIKIKMSGYPLKAPPGTAPSG